MRSSKKKLYFYLHTHWDREWYWAFERYRTQLITVMKLVVEGLEKNLLPNFHFDGQSCALEDFVQLEPEYESRIKALVKSGRLSIGPWYVLNDQMLVGGESMIRNLEYGIARSKRFGKPMMVGYCPDTFGHSQDLPRILKGFGIETAVVWRGVPELDRPEFLWQSPDGSEVVANLLAKGYYQSFIHEIEAELETKLDELIDSLLAWVNLKVSSAQKLAVGTGGMALQKTESYGGAGRLEQVDCPAYSQLLDGALVPVGGDHLKPPRDMTSLTKKVRARLKELSKERSKNGSGSDGLPAVEVESIMLSDYLAMVQEAVKQPATPVRSIEGELRDNKSAFKHAAAYMLAGVLSTRLYLKRENRILEHRLARVSEPLFALMSVTNLIDYPKAEFDNAWTYLLKNQPHDSICGCSVDDVHREMMPRYASANHVLDILDRRVRDELLVPGVHEWSIKHKGKPIVQPPFVNAGVGRDTIDLPDPDVPLAGIAVFNSSLNAQSAPVRISIGMPEGTAATVEAANKFMMEHLRDSAKFQVDSVRKVTDLFGETAGTPLYKNLTQVDGWLWAPEVPGLGSRTIEFIGTAGSGKKLPGGTTGDATDLAPAAVNGKEISNAYFTLRIENDGNLTVDAKDGNGHSKRYSLGHRFQDVGDGGDSYNFDPLLNDKPIHSRLKSVEVGKWGPLVSSLKVVYEIDLPDGAVEDFDGPSFSDVPDLIVLKRSENVVKHEIVTSIILKRGVPVVFFETDWENKASDHRLEVLFDSLSTVTETYSENHMSCVKRHVSSETIDLPVSKYTEAPLDRFPCQRFFIEGEQAFFNLGLPEYGVGEQSVSITVLRAISDLSRRRLFTRGGGAGPYMPVPDANCLGMNRVTYGWAPLAILDGDDNKSKAYKLAEIFEGTLWPTPVTSMGQVALQIAGLEDRSFITVDNENVVCTAFYSQDGGATFMLRLLNPTMEKTTARIRLQNNDLELNSVNLAGKRTKQSQSKLCSVGTAGQPVYEVDFGPNELLTISIERAAPRSRKQSSGK